jgi:hypothetical protein
MKLPGKPIATGSGFGASFGLRVNGRDPGVRFSTIAEALANASMLLAQGNSRVEIYDRSSGRIVQHVIPNPAQA